MDEVSLDQGMVMDLRDSEIEEIERRCTGSGGFQSLFRRLLGLIDKDQKVLRMTPDLATVIVRYASGDYGPGGFQDTLNRSLWRLVDAARSLEESGDYLPDVADGPQLEETAQRETVVEDNLGDAVEEPFPSRYSITSYGADYPAEVWVRRIESGDMYVPEFQRGYVWRYKQASRFVESLLLGLPVPSIFLARDPESGRFLVIDGQQRLRTLQYFYNGRFAQSGRKFALKGVESRFESRTYADLTDADRVQLDNAVIHAIIVKQDEPSHDQSSIYHLFERLNTGGTLLHPQEIRSCIYYGELNNVIRELNQREEWRAIFGPVNPRMRDQELILRFFALLYPPHKYKSPMKAFLNAYMSANRHLALQTAEQLTDNFDATIRLVYASLGAGAFKRVRVLNAAVFDAVMVALATRLSAGAVTHPSEIAERYKDLLNDDQFLSATQTSTAAEEHVSRRIDLALAAFHDAP